jgi:hypothetical protein
MLLRKELLRNRRADAKVMKIGNVNLAIFFRLMIPTSFILIFVFGLFRGSCVYMLFDHCASHRINSMETNHVRTLRNIF